MQRGTYNTVTHLPILIPATPEDQEGVTSFGDQTFPPLPLRTFKDSDLKNAKKHLGKSDVLHFNAVIALIQALQKGSDALALQRAKDAFDEAYRTRPGRSEFAELPEGFAEALGRF